MSKYKLRNHFTRSERRMVFTYHEFIKSNWWTKQKEDWYSRHNKICAVCKTDLGVNLHHQRYPKSGRYLSMYDGEFIALCQKHHYEYHQNYGVKQNMRKTTVGFFKRKRNTCIRGKSGVIPE